MSGQARGWVLRENEAAQLLTQGLRVHPLPPLKPVKLVVWSRNKRFAKRRWDLSLSQHTHHRFSRLLIPGQKLLCLALAVVRHPSPHEPLGMCRSQSHTGDRVARSVEDTLARRGNLAQHCIDDSTQAFAQLTTRLIHGKMHNLWLSLFIGIKNGEAGDEEKGTKAILRWFLHQLVDHCFEQVEMAQHPIEQRLNPRMMPWSSFRFTEQIVSLAGCGEVAQNKVSCLVPRRGWGRGTHSLTRCWCIGT